LIWTYIYFLRQQFSAAIGAAHFPADCTAIDACAAAIFTFFKTYALKKQDGRCKDKENLICMQEIWIKYFKKIPRVSISSTVTLGHCHTSLNVAMRMKMLMKY
jgi:hypothetical protein